VPGDPKVILRERPLQRFETACRCPRTVTRPGAASHGVRCPTERYMRPEREDIGFLAPASTRTFRPDPRGFFRPPSTLSFRQRFQSPVSLPSPTECDDLRPARRSPARPCGPTKARRAPLLRFHPSSRHQTWRPLMPGLPTPELCSVLGVSHALDGLLRQILRGLVSSRSHVQGLPYRGFFLSAEPYRVSPAVSCPRDG
jgi:hypothetical protein